MRLLGAYGGDLGPCRGSAYLVDGRVLLDPGGASAAMTIAEARAIEACVVTHAHLDHVGSLPAILDARDGCPTLPVYAAPETVKVLRDHLFNGRLWPDMERTPHPDRPFLRLIEVRPEQEFTLGDLAFRPVPVHHAVPTVGYVVRSGGRTVVFSGDTGPTDRLWQVVREAGGADAVFLDVSFPDALLAVAIRTGHLAPSQVAAEVAKLPPGTPVHLVHLKPSFVDALHAGLAPVLAAHPSVRLGIQGHEYVWEPVGL